MDMKQKFNTKLKSLVKVPSNFTSTDFKPPNFQINNPFSHGQGKKPCFANLNAISPETIQHIHDKHLPLVIQFKKGKELRECQMNPYLTNSELEQEIINSIEQIYYSDLINEESVNELPNAQVEDVVDDRLDGFVEELITSQTSKNDVFDPKEYILNKLPDSVDLGFISEQKKRLNKQLMVVSKRVYDLIQQNQSTYNNEMVSVRELQAILSDAVSICSSGRFRLDCARKNLTYPNLNIISTYRRREIMISLLKEFYTFKTLLQTELTLNDLIMEDEDYAGAMKLCLECLKIIGSLNRYRCVTDLGAKLNCTIQMTEEKLDLALARLCVNFNNNQFNKIRETFNLLGKTQFLYDRLLIHFSSVINEKAFNIVNSYVELCTNLNDSFASSSNNSSIKQRSFEDVCSSLSSDCFLQCLIDLNKSMYHIMINYKKFASVHSFDSSHSIGDESEQNNDFDCDQTLIKQKMRHGLAKIWQEIENKQITLIKNHKLSIYSFDDFISMINIVRKMISIGHEFANIKQSDQVEVALKKATSDYFYSFHKTKMEEIKVFLETELWQLIPMKSDFSIEQLHEFNFLKGQKYLSSKVDAVENAFEGKYFSENMFDSKNQETPFDRFMSHRNNEIKGDEQVMGEKFEVKDQTSVKENDEKVPVLITNSSLNIMRIVGKYMQIMVILDQISFDVLLCIFHLFDYYLYGVYVFFANDQETNNQFYSMSPSLSNNLKRIESTLIKDKSILNETRLKFHTPELFNMVDLNARDHLFGLFERAVGVESLVFLGNQLRKIYEPILSLINEKDKVWLEQFFNQTVNVAAELRETIYMHVAFRYIHPEQIVQSMEKINWEVKEEIRSENNQYVDELIQNLQLFRMKENDLVQFSSKLNQFLSQLLWNQMLKLVNFIFIDGFSSAKKCTNEGRALMQLDYQHYLCSIEKFVTVKPIPNKELVEEYIKAFYYTEDLLENLVNQKREYTLRQLKSLINCVLITNKKGRQRLLTLIDTVYAT